MDVWGEVTQLIVNTRIKSYAATTVTKEWIKTTAPQHPTAVAPQPPTAAYPPIPTPTNSPVLESHVTVSACLERRPPRAVGMSA